MRIQGIQMFRGADGAVIAQVTVKAADSNAAFAEADRALQALTAGKEMELSIAPVRKSRSKDANALLWACLQDIAQALGVDKWGVYLEMLRRYTKGPLICKPNAGVPTINSQGIAEYAQPIGEFGQILTQCRENGATVLGGCCGTTPEHIRMLKEFCR